MFNTEEVKDDKNLGYNTVINGLNSIKKNKKYEKVLTLRQNKLSKENVKKLFILSLKELSNLS